MRIKIKGNEIKLVGNKAGKLSATYRKCPKCGLQIKSNHAKLCRSCWKKSFE